MNLKTKNILYWIAWFTWGFPMAFIGALVTVFLIIIGYNTNTFCGDVYINIGERWGGLELGPFFLTDKRDNLDMKKHERGHGEQWVLGPLVPFIVTIPSACRYWLREQPTYERKEKFAVTLGSILIFIAGIIFLLGLALDLAWLGIIGILLIIYFTALGIWLLMIECPKYADNQMPPYDDFKIEAWATEAGEKVYQEYKDQNLL